MGTSVTPVARKAFVDFLHAAGSKDWYRVPGRELQEVEEIDGIRADHGFQASM